MNGVRSFVAIELSQSLRARLVAAQNAIRQHAPNWRGEKWVAEHNLHCTLRFLGDLSEGQLGEVRSSLAATLGDVARFEIVLAGLRAVPSARRCSMVWARLGDDTAALVDLAARVEAVVVGVGLEPETRPFTPHVTLVRARRPHSLPSNALSSAVAALSAAPALMSDPSVTLFVSTLTRTGPVYERVDSWPLVTRE